MSPSCKCTFLVFVCLSENTEQTLKFDNIMIQTQTKVNNDEDCQIWEYNHKFQIEKMALFVTTRENKEPKRRRKVIDADLNRSCGMGDETRRK